MDECFTVLDFRLRALHRATQRIGFGAQTQVSENRAGSHKPLLLQNEENGPAWLKEQDENQYFPTSVSKFLYG